MDAQDPESLLLARVADGDESALPELYDSLAPALTALALRLCRRREDADEVVQDTFLRLCREARRFDPRLGSVRALAYTMARNLARSRWRALQARPTVIDIDPDGPVGSVDPWPQQDTRILAEAALASLAPLDRRLLEDAFLDGRSHSELADVHGLPIGTVKSRLRRALLKLRHRWGEP